MTYRFRQLRFCAVIALGLLCGAATLRAQDAAVAAGPEQRLAAAERHLMQGDLDDAAGLFKSVRDAADAPAEKRVLAAWGLAQCLAAQKQWAEAADVILQMASGQQEIPAKALWLAGQSYCRAGADAKAAEAFKLAAATKGPLAVDALFQYGLCLGRSGKTLEADNALKLYGRRVEDPGKLAEAALFRAMYNYRLKRFEDAASLGREAMKGGTDDLKIRAAILVGMADLALGKPKEALEVTKSVGDVKAPELAGQIKFIRELAGTELGQGGGLEETARKLLAMPEFERGDAQQALLFYLSALFEANGRPADSLKYLTQALKTARPAARNAIYGEIGRLHARMKHFTEAFGAYEEAGDTAKIEALCRALLKAEVKQPGKFIACFRLALIDTRRNDFGQAARVLSDGMVGLNAPELLDLAEFARAYFLEQKGQLKEAVTLYEKVAVGCKGEFAVEARRRAILISLAENRPDLVVDFYKRLSQKAKPDLSALELYAVGVSYFQAFQNAGPEAGARATAPAAGRGTRAALRAEAAPLFKTLLNRMADEATGTDAEPAQRAHYERLLLPALVRFMVLTENREDAFFALKKLEQYAGLTVRQKLRTGAAGPYLSPLECLVAAELRRVLGQCYQAVDLYDSTLAGVSAIPSLADTVRLQMGECLTLAGMSTRAQSTFKQISDDSLLLKARIGLANALAAGGGYDSALAQIKDLARNPDAKDVRKELEQLQKSIESMKDRGAPEAE